MWTNDHRLPRLRQAALLAPARAMLAGYMPGGSRELGDIDGATLQDEAIRAGLLEWVEVAAPCGDDCACAEAELLPGMCARVPGWLLEDR